VTTDERYMLVALRLARRGLGYVEPNPAVGAVVVKAGKIIGRGWHKKFGGAHAEINALADCRKRGNSPKNATMYVTLEPCCHYGKTGPCTEAIIAAKLKKVVVATNDPSKHANGKGIRQLRKAGIRVDVGDCEGQARVLNAPFLKFASTDKPWVTLKWAQSIDGKLARTGPGSKKYRWISCEASREDAHKLRNRVGAILVGINTVLKDDPLLTPRPDTGKKPIRIVLDNHLRIPLDCQLLSTTGESPVLIVTREKTLKKNNRKAKQIVGRGAEMLACPQKSKSNIQFLLKQLSHRGVQRLLVEGGPTVIGSFLKENLADEIVVYIAPRILGAAGCADITGATIKVLESDILFWCKAKNIYDDVRISGLTTKGFDATFDF
jgi:diaminohydroxyphosphoribosylaminopyrimidine deaminase/5-amino-6-(5-phosphoribosylamino)uracil reductase